MGPNELLLLGAIIGGILIVLVIVVVLGLVRRQR